MSSTKPSPIFIGTVGEKWATEQCVAWLAGITGEWTHLIIDTNGRTWRLDNEGPKRWVGEGERLTDEELTRQAWWPVQLVVVGKTLSVPIPIEQKHVEALRTVVCQMGYWLHGATWRTSVYSAGDEVFVNVIDASDEYAGDHFMRSLETLAKAQGLQFQEVLHMVMQAAQTGIG